MGGPMAVSAEFVEDAEDQLLELLRGEDVSSFSVTIVCGNDKWIISTTDTESGAYCIGQGPTFADRGMIDKIKYSRSSNIQ